jgi:hypothetical protein
MARIGVAKKEMSAVTARPSWFGLRTFYTATGIEKARFLGSSNPRLIGPCEVRTALSSSRIDAIGLTTAIVPDNQAAEAGVKQLARFYETAAT